MLKLGYMGIRFTKKKKKRTRYRLNPKEAEEVIRQEFTDSKGNKHIFRMDVTPHSPSKPTIQGTVEYKDNE